MESIKAIFENREQMASPFKKSLEFFRGANGKYILFRIYSLVSQIILIIYK